MSGWSSLTTRRRRSDLEIQVEHLALVVMSIAAITATVVGYSTMA